MAIETQLEKNKRSLKDFKPMSYPKDCVLYFLRNMLIYDERKYGYVSQNKKFQNLYSSLTDKVNMLFIHLSILL